MKQVFISVILLAVIAAFAQDVRAQENSPRAESGPFVNLRGGVSSYGGDRDADFGESVFKPQFGDASYSLGLEGGVILSPAFSLSLGFQFARYPSLGENPAGASADNPDYPVLSDETSVNRATIPLLLRWMMIRNAKVSPYLNAGGNLTLGSHEPLGGEKKTEVGVGPSVGLGVDFVVSSHNSIFLETTYHLTFNDFKVDAADSSPVSGPVGEQLPESNSSFDALSFWGVGVRHSFRPACGPPTIDAIEVPQSVNLGEPASFSLIVDEDACRPVEVTWDLGGGGPDLVGLGASHMFETPGTYTVSVTATNSKGSDSGTTMIEVIDPCPIDAEIIAINLSPSDPIINETITFTADVRGTEPVSYAWDFGDGSTATGESVGHVYNEPGDYTVSLTCSNCGGTDSRSITIVVREFRCDDLTELNSVFFRSNSAELDGTATGLLDENVSVLNECADKLVRIDGYADRGELRPQSLSSRRASAVEQYYLNAGISASRVMARGLGRDPLAGKGVDGTRNRRADSIIVDSFE